MLGIDKYHLALANDWRERRYARQRANARRRNTLLFLTATTLSTFVGVVIFAVSTGLMEP
jgi:hypothetical protein